MLIDTAKFYRREADRLLSLITALTDSAQQLELLQMARQYVKMADLAEAREERADTCEALYSPFTIKAPML
jgi:hypothetical protein